MPIRIRYRMCSPKALFLKCGFVPIVVDGPLREEKIVLQYALTWPINSWMEWIQEEVRIGAPEFRPFESSRKEEKNI